MFRKTKIQIEKKINDFPPPLPRRALQQPTAPKQSEEEEQQQQPMMPEQSEQQQQSFTRMDRIRWALGFCSSVLGAIGGIYAIHEVFLTWIFPVQEKFEIVVYRK